MSLKYFVLSLYFMESHKEIIDNFLAITETQDREYANKMLDQNKWDLDNAVNEHIAFSQNPISSPNKRHCLLNIDHKNVGFFKSVRNYII